MKASSGRHAPEDIAMILRTTEKWIEMFFNLSEHKTIRILNIFSMAANHFQLVYSIEISEKVNKKFTIWRLAARRFLVSYFRFFFYVGVVAANITGVWTWVGVNRFFQSSTRLGKFFMVCETSGMVTNLNFPNFSHRRCFTIKQNKTALTVFKFHCG